MPIDPKKIEGLKARLALADRVGFVGGSAVAREAAYEAVPALLAERESMLSLLREVEWSGRALVPQRSGPPASVVGCPWCHGEARRSPVFPDRLEGHAPDRRLAAFLGGK